MDKIDIVFFVCVFLTLFNAFIMFAAMLIAIKLYTEFIKEKRH